MTIEIYEALSAVDDLSTDSAERERLWVAIWSKVTTVASTGVTPLNSTVRIQVTKDYASVELIAAWEWLVAHEEWARTMEPHELQRTLRGVATRSHNGSGRAAMADALCGISDVPPNVRVRIDSDDACDDGGAR